MEKNQGYTIDIPALVFKLARRHKGIFFLFFFFSIVSTLLHHTFAPSYITKSTIHAQTPESSPLVSTMTKLRGVQFNPFATAEYIDRHVKFLTSNSFNKFIAERISEDMNLKRWAAEFAGYKLHKVDLQDLDSADLADSLIGSIQVKKVDYDTIDLVSFAADPHSAVKAANTVAEFSIMAIIETETKELADAKEYLAEEIKKSQKRLHSLNSEIESYKKQGDLKLASMSASQAYQMLGISKLQEELQMIEVAIEENAIQAKKYKLLLDRIIERNIANQDLATQLYDNRGRVSDRLAELEDQLSILGSKRDALKIRIRELDKQIDPQYEQKIYGFQKELELEYSLFENLRRQEFETSVQQISAKNSVNIYNKATLRETYRKVSALRKLVAAAIGSIFISFLLFLLWEKMRPIVSNRNDLENIGLTYLSHIPKFDLKKNPLHFLSFKGESSPVVQRMPLFNFKNDSEGVRAFRFLRHRVINLLRAQKESKIISFVSTSSNDGKSFISTNLALSIASIRKRILLVDCDFHREEGLLDDFIQEPIGGIADALHKKEDAREFILKDVLPGLDFLPSGKMKEEDWEILADHRFSQIVKQLSEDYDLVIIDAPAHSEGPDAIQVSSVADFPIVVATADHTPAHNVQEIIELLSVHEFEQVFAILNKYTAPFSADFNSSGYGRSKYRNKEKSA